MEGTTNTKKQVKFTENQLVYRYVLWPPDFKFENANDDLFQMGLGLDFKDDFYESIQQKSANESCRRNIITVILSMILFFMVMWWIANQMLLKEIEKQIAEYKNDVVLMFSKLLV